MLCLVWGWSPEWAPWCGRRERGVGGWRGRQPLQALGSWAQVGAGTGARLWSSPQLSLLKGNRAALTVVVDLDLPVLDFWHLPVTDGLLNVLIGLQVKELCKREGDQALGLRPPRHTCTPV